MLRASVTNATVLREVEPSLELGAILPASLLARAGAHGHILAMFTRRLWRRIADHVVIEWMVLAIGVILLIASPLVGAIPGPGGVVVAGLGLALILKNSTWARRRYVKLKRWQPRAGRWTDLALRRPSARRREAIRKARVRQARQAPCN